MNLSGTDGTQGGAVEPERSHEVNEDHWFLRTCLFSPRKKLVCGGVDLVVADFHIFIKGLKKALEKIHDIMTLNAMVIF